MGLVADQVAVVGLLRVGLLCVVAAVHAMLLRLTVVLVFTLSGRLATDTRLVRWVHLLTDTAISTSLLTTNISVLVIITPFLLRENA